MLWNAASARARGGSEAAARVHPSSHFQNASRFCTDASRFCTDASRFCTDASVLTRLVSVAGRGAGVRRDVQRRQERRQGEPAPPPAPRPAQRLASIVLRRGGRGREGEGGGLYPVLGPQPAAAHKGSGRDERRRRQVKDHRQALPELDATEFIVPRERRQCRAPPAPRDISLHCIHFRA